MIVTPFPQPPAPGEAIAVADDVMWLRVPLPMALDHVNAYALRDDDGWTLIDTGLDTAKTRALWEGALAGPLAGQPIRRLIVTHHHPDHVGLAGWFQARGAELLMPRTAWLMARMLCLDEQVAPSAETLAHWQGAGMTAALFDKRRTERPFNFCDVVHPLPLGFTRLHDGGTIRMGGRDWDIRFGQGHAPDHATFWSRDDHLVIGGDQLLATISPNLGVYATEPGADPVAEWLESCAGFQPLARPAHLVLPGHKLPFTGLPDRLRQLIDNHHGALARLRDHLSKGPRCAADCFAPLFKRQIDDGTYGLALVEAVAHLNHLLALGAVARTRRADGAWLYHLIA
ncbi:MBL fold metallo-hydrolase [Rhodobacterales bacterium LSUCC0031]|nr:MBL fold metallo-hydrolase [Rhodobacterales bacterium LSUCC0031]